MCTSRRTKEEEEEMRRGKMSRGEDMRKESGETEEEGGEGSE